MVDNTTTFKRPLQKKSREKDDDDILEIKSNRYTNDDQQQHTKMRPRSYSFWETVNYTRLPNWLQDNNYIQDGHRPPMPSFKACFKSIFAIHTETGNIWTHLIGSLSLFVLMTWFTIRKSNTFVWQDKVIFNVFFIGAIICLTFSTLYHTVRCHSKSVFRFTRKLDYAGISVMILGSFVPWVYYSFICQPKIMAFYALLLSVFGCLSIIVSMFDKFMSTKYRPIRSATFISLGLCGVFPCGHFVLINGGFKAVIMQQQNNTGLDLLLWSAAFYIFGAVIYAMRFPEKYFFEGGRFDIWFQSHQIFHVCVVAGALANFAGTLNIARLRAVSGDCMGVLFDEVNK